MKITAYDLAHRFLGLQEAPGAVDNPQVLAMLQLDQSWPEADSVPWCSAFVNYICWLLRLPRSRSLRARSWLLVGHTVAIEDARPGFDLVVLKRDGLSEPGPDVLKASGHVGFFAGCEFEAVEVLGGNQGDAVSLRRYPTVRILGVRRLLCSEG